jgi:hypothetical protein
LGTEKKKKIKKRKKGTGEKRVLMSVSIQLLNPKEKREIDL